MPNTIPARGEHSEAVQALLTAQVDIPVGGGKAPAGGGWQGAPGSSAFVAYMVVHSGNGGTLTGPLGDPHADAEWIWTVAGYGATDTHAEWAVDQARAALLARRPNIVINGRAVTRVVEDISGAGREDPDQPSTFRAFANFRITTSPRSP